MNDQLLQKFFDFFQDFSKLMEKIYQSQLFQQFLALMKEGGRILVMILEFLTDWLKRIIE
jgi:hypothetical protein